MNVGSLRTSGRRSVPLVPHHQHTPFRQTIRCRRQIDQGLLAKTEGIGDSETPDKVQPLRSRTIEPQTSFNGKACRMQSLAKFAPQCVASESQSKRGRECDSKVGIEFRRIAARL